MCTVCTKIVYTGKTQHCTQSEWILCDQGGGGNIYTIYPVGSIPMLAGAPRETLDSQPLNTNILRTILIILGAFFRYER